MNPDVIRIEFTSLFQFSESKTRREVLLPIRNQRVSGEQSTLEHFRVQANRCKSGLSCLHFGSVKIYFIGLTGEERSSQA